MIMAAGAAMEEPAVTEKAFDEFHLYHWPGPRRCSTVKPSRWSSSAPRT